MFRKFEKFEQYQSSLNAAIPKEIQERNRTRDCKKLIGPPEISIVPAEISKELSSKRAFRKTAQMET